MLTELNQYPLNDSVFATTGIRLPAKISRRFEQWRLSGPYSWNDLVFPPAEFPKGGFNTLDVSGGVYMTHWRVYCCAGNIVGWTVGDTPTTLTASIDSTNANIAYLNAQGFTGAIAGSWIAAGAVGGNGNTFYIGTFSGVQYFFVPNGVTLSASTIPDYFSWGGTYVFCKTPDFGGVTTFGIAINTWDGTHRYGTLNAVNDPKNASGATGLFAVAPLSDYRLNGVAHCTFDKDLSTGVIYGGSREIRQLFSVIVPSREETNILELSQNCLVQFDGYWITPQCGGGLTPTSFSMNTI